MSFCILPWTRNLLMLHTLLRTLALEESNVDTEFQPAFNMGNNCKNGHPTFINPLIKKQCGVAVGCLLANCSLVPVKHMLAIGFGEVRAALRPKYV